MHQRKSSIMGGVLDALTGTSECSCTDSHFRNSELVDEATVCLEKLYWPARNLVVIN